MLAALFAQATDWVAPTIDWHAIAPELVLVAGINIVLLIDLNISESKKWIMATLTGFVMLAALIPVVTLFVIGDDSRSMFGGRYVIDEYALIMKALFLPGEWDPVRAREMAEDDWLRDLGNGFATMHKAEFYDSLFEVAALCTRRLKVADI